MDQNDNKQVEGHGLADGSVARHGTGPRELGEIITYAISAYKKGISLEKIFTATATDPNGYLAHFIVSAIEYHRPDCRNLPVERDTAHPAAPAAGYNRRQIAWELERTALGDGHFGNALRVAKDFPEASAEDRALLDRYATGRNSGTDHVALQSFALRIYTAAPPGIRVPLTAPPCSKLTAARVSAPSGGPVATEGDVNLLNSAALFLGSRTETEWAKKYGYSELMKMYSERLTQISAKLNTEGQPAHAAIDRRQPKGRAANVYREKIAALVQEFDLPPLGRGIAACQIADLLDEVLNAGTTDDKAGGQGQKVTEQGHVKVGDQFWNWFGNSKVTDAHGNPQIVYHGTAPSEFRPFPEEGIKEFLVPAYFADTPATAADFAQQGGAHIYPVYLSIENPKEAFSEDEVQAPYDDLDELLAEGYDGMVWRNEEAGETYWVAFKPEQIKFAIGSRAVDGESTSWRPRHPFENKLAGHTGEGECDERDDSQSCTSMQSMR